MSDPESKTVRKILHVDMDAFYASVEQRDRPELRGRPVVVGGSPDSRGVVASASYEARRFGIRSAMSSRKAYRLCPQAVFVPPDFGAYQEASRRIRELFLEITPWVEPLSLDEAYLDVTENALNEPLARNVAIHVKNEIRKRTGLTASAGAGPNKFIAKVASDLKKPDGLVVIHPSRALEFIAKLPVENLWGVGPRTAARLHALGLKTAKDIRSCDPALLERELGKFGNFLHGLAHGIDSRPVEPDWDPKSSGSETTFETDIVDLEILRRKLVEQITEISEWLVRNERLGRTVTIKVRYANFKTITRSRTLAFPTLHRETFERVAWDLLRNGTEAGATPIRLIGFSVSSLIRRDDPVQLWFEFK